MRLRSLILALGAAHAQRTPEKHPQGSQLVTRTQRSKGRCALVASCGGYMDMVLPPQQAHNSSPNPTLGTEWHPARWAFGLTLFIRPMMICASWSRRRRTAASTSLSMQERTLACIPASCSSPQSTQGLTSRRCSYTPLVLFPMKPHNLRARSALSQTRSTSHATRRCSTRVQADGVAVQLLPLCSRS